MKHPQFKARVPESIQNKMHAIVQHVKDVGGIRECFFEKYIEYFSEETIEVIEGNYVSGWIPRQNGGWSIDAFIDSDISNYLTEKQKESNEEDYENMLESFKSDNGLDDIDYDNEEILEELSSYEREWNTPALLQFQIFVDEDGVTLRVSINYRDAPYYREKYGEDIAVLVLETSEFVSENIESIVSELKSRIK